uniref:Peptidase S1 domain-containing protein n=1 Tax=Anopheles farauti TaxID=69004 RepID=A0A182QDW6_9DIPT
MSVSSLVLLLLSLTIPLIASNSICGRRPIAAPGTITNGQSSWPGQFPWHLALYHRAEQRLTVEYACGGFIVGERVVITAAHCVTAPSGYQLAADELTVRVGLHDLLTLARHSQEHRVRTVHRHANFTAGSTRHDLALLTLRTIVEFGAFVQPICLPRTAGQVEPMLAPKFGVVSCWGLTEGTNVCNGDSGGAMVANLNGSWTAFGIVSITGVREDKTPFRSDTKSLAGFINILAYLGWIESVASAEGVTFCNPEEERPPADSPDERISERVCRRYRASCAGRADIAYTASVVHPIGQARFGQIPPLEVDCYAVLISDRFLLARASCQRRAEGASLARQLIILEVAGEARGFRIRTFHQHPNFVKEQADQSYIALIELERKVPLSTCHFVCLWYRPDILPPNIFLYSTDDISSEEEDEEEEMMLMRAIRTQNVAGKRSPFGELLGRPCYEEPLTSMVMLQELVEGRYDRLVAIVHDWNCTNIRFIQVAPFLGWIKGIVWPNSSAIGLGSAYHTTHFSSGFMPVPSGQWNVSENSFRFESGPITRYLGGEWESFSICRVVVSSVTAEHQTCANDTKNSWRWVMFTPGSGSVSVSVKLFRSLLM